MFGFHSIEKAKEGNEMFFPAVACKISCKDENIRVYPFIS
jgi:hypothetical protein